MDDTKKALLSIDIDTAALTQNAANAKAAVAALADQLKELKAAGKDSGEAFDKINEKLKEQLKTLSDNAKALKDFKANLNDLTKAQSDLNKVQGDTNGIKAAEDAQKKLQHAVAETDALLKQSSKEYKNADDKGKTKQIEELITAYNNLSISQRENYNIGGRLEERIAGLKAEQKGITIDQDNLNNSINNGTQLFVKHKSILDTSTGSISNTKAAISTLTHEYFNLSEEQRNNANIGGILNKKIEELQQNLQKLNSKSISDFTDRVVAGGKSILPFSDGIGKVAEQFKTLKEGAAKAIDGINSAGKSFSNYLATVKALSAEQNDLKGNISGFSKGFQTLKSGFEVATGGAQNFGKALAGTGIGLIIIAVGLLVDYFKKFQPVVDLVERVMEGFNGALAAGKHILDEFFGSIHSVGDLLSKLGNIIAHPIDSLLNLGKTMVEAATKTAKLKGAQQELDEELQQSASRNTDRDAKLAQLRAQMLGASVEQHKKIAKQIKEIEDAKFAESQHLEEKQVNITLARVNAINKLNKQEAFDINNLTEAKIQDLEKTRHLDAETVKSLREALKQRNTSREEYFNHLAKDRKQEQDNSTADHDKKKAAAEKHNQDMALIQASKNRILLNGMKEGQAKELAELQISFEEQAKQYKNNTLVLQQLAKEREQKIKEIEAKYATEEKDQKAATEKAVFDAQQQTLILEAKDDFEKIHKLKQEQNSKDLEFELANSKKTEADKEILRQQYKQREIIEDREFFAAKKTFLEKQIEDDKKLNENEKDPAKKKKAELKLIQEEYNLEVLLAQGNKERLEQIAVQHQSKIEALDKKASSDKKKTFSEEFALLDQKAHRYADNYTKITSIFSKNTLASKSAFMAQKAIAVAEIAINTEKQVSASISATKNQVAEDSKLSFPIGTILIAKDIALGAIDVASTIANGAKQAASINGTNVQGFARGGLYQSDGYGAYLTGPGSGTSDSINAKLSNGESIINARSTQMFAPILSAINQAGGGRAFNSTNPCNAYAQGGLFNGSNTLNDGYSELANMRALNDIAKTMAANMPRQILVVEDIQASLQNKAMLQSMSNF